MPGYSPGSESYQAAQRERSAKIKASVDAWADEGFDRVPPGFVSYEKRPDGTGILTLLGHCVGPSGEALR